MTNHYDIIIAGGGLVGNTLALALAEYPLKIAIVEKALPSQQIQFDYDARSIALSYGSRQLFEYLKLWPLLKPHVTPILKVHVSDEGRFGFSRIEAKKLQVPALGYVIEMQHFLQVLMTALKQYPHIHRICPATVRETRQQDNGWQLMIEKQQDVQTYETTLLVAADGGQSFLREKLNIPLKKWDFNQQAIIANVGLSDTHQQVAYERFTKSGPLALLPMSEKRSALVWTSKREDYQAILEQTDETFLNALQRRFGYRLGKFIKVGKRFSFPLMGIYATEQVKPGFVLLGNSAHTLHPVAGQGFNLCLRDVTGLAKVLKMAMDQDQSLGDFSLLQGYFHERQKDQLRTLNYSNHLVSLFSNDFLPLALMRNLGLVTVDFLPPCKRILAKLNMGIYDAESL